MDIYLNKNKMIHRDNMPVQAKYAAVHLKDNRPGSVSKKNQLNNSSIQNNTQAPVQRTISFAIGKQQAFNNIEELKTRLKALYDKSHHEQIDALVDDANKPDKGSISVLEVFRQIKQIGARDKWTEVSQAVASSGHGPSLPAMDLHGVKENKRSAMSTFMTPRATLAKAQLILPNKEIESFQAKQEGAHAHAEDVLIREITAYIKKKGIDSRRCGLRITINNAPCGEDEKNCAATLRAFKEAMGFNYFRLYYMSPYGTGTGKSVAHMRAGGIKVSNFSPKDLGLNKGDYKATTWKKIQSHVALGLPPGELDPWSDDETEKKESKKGAGEATETKRSGRTPAREEHKGDRKENRSGSRGRTPKPETKREKSKSRSRSRGKKKGAMRNRSMSPGKKGPKYPALDGNRLFDDLGPQLTMGARVELEGYQVAELLEILGDDPVGETVTFNDLELRVVRLARGLPKTEYNPDGLALGLQVRRKGG